MKCLNCQKDTKNPRYCSRSCSAICTNKLYPRRSKTKKCFSCDNLIALRAKFCKNCIQYIKNKFLNTKLKDYLFKHPTDIYAKLRSHARNTYIKSKQPLACKICQYTKAVDICHIKPVHKFSNNSTIGKVNNLSNLVALCKNHHWELDHNLLSLKDKQKIGAHGIEP